MVNRPEVSLTVADFSIYVNGRSFNSLLFSLINSSFLALSFSWPPILPWGGHLIERETKGAKMMPKNR